MVSSWLPQNIQKRIFKYFLNRLSVFSNLDLENVDVSVGTTSNFSLSDVQLDTEKITIPGIYLRDGHIRKLDIKLGMMGGVNIDGSDVDLSIALSSPRIDDLSTLLSRTTADLAHSIVLPGEDMEDEEADADSFENEGFGFGEFKPTVIKAVDVAISQLSINLCNISIRLTVDHETTLLLSIGRITMRTMDPGIRHVVVSDVEVVLVSPDLHTLGSGQLNDATDTSHPSTEEGGDFNELEASQLMESMVFSHEEASSMYMSALSTVLEETQNAPPKPRILWCRKADVHFKGLGEDITFDIDQVHGSLYPIPVVLMSLLKKFKEIMMSDGSPNKSTTVVDDDDEKETEATYNRFAKISIASVSLGIGTLLPNGLFEDPDMIVFTLSECSLDLSRSSSLFLVNKISVNTGEKNILKFKKGNDSELDFTCQLVSSGITILLPNPAFMNLSLKELGPLLASLREINLALATVSQSSEMEPNIKRDESSTANVYIQTNTFEICLDSGSLVSTITIFPATAKDDLMQIDKIIIKLQHDLITAQNLVISLNHNGLAHIIQQDSMEVQAEVGTSVTLDSLLIDGSHSSLIHLLQDFQKWSIPENQTIVLSDQSPTTTPTMAPQTPRGVQISVKKIPISVKIIKIEIKIRLPKQIGIFDADAGNTIVNIIASDIVQISISTIYLSRDFSDIDPTVKHIPLVYNAIPSKNSPMVFAELNQDGLQELKMTGVSFAYHVRLLKLVEIIGQYKSSEVRSSEIPMSKLSDSTATIKESKMNITIFFVDCVIELNPFDGAAKGLFLVKDGQVVLSLGQNSSSNSLNLNIHKSWTLLIDDVDYLDKTAATTTHKQRYIHSQDFVNSFLKQGYTMIASLSSISSNFSISPHSTGELNIELLAIDSCADSTQTLIKLINGLKPQIEAQEDVRYRTEPYPANVFENIDENAFGDHSVLQNDISRFSEDMVSDDVPSNLDFVESYYTEQPSRYKWSGSSSGVSSSSHYSKADLLLDQDLSLLAAKSGGSSGDGSSLHNSGDSFQSSFGIFEQRVQSHDSVLAISDDYFSQKQKSSRSNSVNTIYSAHSDKTQQNFKRGKDSLSLAMFRIDVKCEKIIWNLYDGYDWEYTRNAISSAVKRVEVVANEVHRQFEKEKEEAATTNFTEQDDDHIDVLENAVVGDLLFNSIYVGVPASQDPKDLRKEINRDINMNDDATESSSLSGSSFNRSKTSNSSRRASMDYKKRLKLRRSKTHKVAIKIEKLNVELSVFDTLESSKVEDGILLNRVGIKIRDLEILDNVSTSTWNKFLFYMRSAGEREYDADMADIVLDSVRPVHDLAVSELILTVSVLPLRLHVDQDTLDFLTRFFEFKDDRIYLGENLDEEEIFIQKADIHAIKVKLDYKPKKVDYAGLKSGHTTEFMNFFVLDEADIVLKHVELYGVSGFPKLAKILNGIWMPDIRTTQLGDVLAGLAPVRSLVRLGNGVRDLIWIPIEEYQKDGRLVRGIQKGAWTFARNATTELVKLGAKLAAGTQAILESAEQAMGGSGAAARVHERPGKRYVSPYSDSLEDYEDEEEFYHEYSEDIPSLTGSYEASLSSIGGNGSNVQHSSQRKIISLYADQPQNIRQGITLAYQSLGRNMSLASQAVQDIGPDAAQRGSAKGAAAAVAKAAPVAIIRPLIGTTEAVSRTLLGVTNQLDPEQMKDVEDKREESH